MVQVASWWYRQCEATPATRLRTADLLHPPNALILPSPAHSLGTANLYASVSPLQINMVSELEDARRNRMHKMNSASQDAMPKLPTPASTRK